MIGHAKEATKDSVHAGVPAQSYEVDILPRYKEALSLGLSSYKHHLQKSNRGSASGSFFKVCFCLCFESIATALCFNFVFLCIFNELNLNHLIIFYWKLKSCNLTSAVAYAQGWVLWLYM